MAKHRGQLRHFLAVEYNIIATEPSHWKPMESSTDLILLPFNIGP